ncbi:hypothetical protein LY632_06505 [Erythrobacter sp. SDW2]|uniref:hypothetical protein n=1 Tax=Erythrobacter sp. SDW2 TaxID=2907154 RepID=UPI001F387AD8|nr:hypothetical protein [Erythrobacter sp. SDW2]UIP08039.1 hypothetical protein LY632_06505 [Erythrobacter sp. SDW2]
MTTPEHCAAPVAGFPVFWWNKPSFKPGQVVELRLTIVRGPSAENGDADCLEGMAVVPAGPDLARGKDGVWRLTIPDDVADGAEYVVEASYGDRKVGSRFVTFRPDEQPLVGRWSQKAEECDGAEPLRELEFRADGSFSATWYPFETYQDYWGTYRYEPDSGTLTLDITGGNALPGDAASGTIELEGDSFVAGTASFGSRPRGICTAPFTR